MLDHFNCSFIGDAVKVLGNATPQVCLFPINKHLTVQSLSYRSTPAAFWQTSWFFLPPHPHPKKKNRRRFLVKTPMPSRNPPGHKVAPLQVRSGRDLADSYAAGGGRLWVAKGCLSLCPWILFDGSEMPQTHQLRERTW